MNKTARAVSAGMILIFTLALVVFITVAGINCGQTNMWLVTGPIGFIGGLGISAVMSGGD